MPQVLLSTSRVDNLQVSLKFSESVNQHAVGLAKPGAPLTVKMRVDGNQVANMTTQRSVPASFTASETFDVVVDLGSPVSTMDEIRRPFAFTGKTDKMTVELSE